MHSITYLLFHQLNLEYIARVVFNYGGILYPDSVLGTDSQTTMIDVLGIVGWGVGGIEAKVEMLGQPMSIVLPGVVGFKLSRKLKNGVMATDFVLIVTQMLQKHGVMGKFMVWPSNEEIAKSILCNFLDGVEFSPPQENDGNIAITNPRAAQISECIKFRVHDSQSSMFLNARELE